MDEEINNIIHRSCNSTSLKIMIFMASMEYEKLNSICVYRKAKEK